MHYQYGAYYAAEEGLVALLTSLFSSIPSFAISIATYVLSSLALYTLAKRRGINHPWLGWVPVANVWILGSLSDQYRYVVRGEIKSKRKVLLTLNILTAVFSVIMVVAVVILAVRVFGAVMFSTDPEAVLEDLLGPMFGIAGLSIPMAGVAIATAIVRYMALYDVYTSCDPSNNVLFLVLSIIFGVTEPFFLFFSRNKDGGMPPRRQEPAYIPPQEYNWQPPQWQQEQPRWQPPQQPPQEPWNSENKDYL